MPTFFVPYDRNTPAAIEIKGHRLLIMSTSKEEIEEELTTVGANEIREITVAEDETEPLAELAASVNGGVVLSPPGLSISALVLNLEQELPWLQ